MGAQNRNGHSATLKKSSRSFRRATQQNKPVAPLTPYSLSMMPLEIKERIINCLVPSGLKVDTDWAHDDPAFRICPSWYLSDHSSDSDRSDHSSQSSDLLEIEIAIPAQPPYLKTLCLIDTTFYGLCRRKLWKSLDLEHCSKSTVRNVCTQVIPRHAKYIESIRWRLACPESCRSRRGANRMRRQRSADLLSILQACPNLAKLDIDLAIGDRQNLMRKFIEPLSNLTSLTSLTLSTPPDQPPSSQQFLANVLAELDLLESFTCSRIKASPPTVLPSDRTRRSHLGLCLSNMHHLRSLDLTDAHCLDLSWSEMSWYGLEKLGLKNCHVSIDVLFCLTKRLSQSLRMLEFHEVSAYDDYASTRSSTVRQDLKAQKYDFNLPALEVLSLSSCLPTRFVRAFRGCDSVIKLSLGKAPGLKASRLKTWIEDCYWPHLRRLKVTRGTSGMCQQGLLDLQGCCDDMQIDMVVTEELDNVKEQSAVDHLARLEAYNRFTNDSPLGIHVGHHGIHFDHEDYDSDGLLFEHTFHNIWQQAAYGNDDFGW